MLRYVPCISNPSRTFYHEWVFILSKAFLHLMTWSCHFCLQVCLDGGFLRIKPSLHLLDDVHLIMVDDHFDVFLDSVCRYSIEYFCGFFFFFFFFLGTGFGRWFLFR